MLKGEQDLEASDDRLHPGVLLQLFDGNVTQGVGVLPLAAALCHAQEAVQVKGYNAREPHKPAYTGWAYVLAGIASQSCIAACCSGECCYCSEQACVCDCCCGCRWGILFIGYSGQGRAGV